MCTVKISVCSLVKFNSEKINSILQIMSVLNSSYILHTWLMNILSMAWYSRHGELALPLQMLLCGHAYIASLTSRAVGVAYEIKKMKRECPVGV